MPDISDPAPDFSLPRNDGDNVSLSDLRGAPVVLFFYPRDDTPGCTRESIGFSEVLQSFADKGVTVFGVSKDSVESHEGFAAKHGLSVPLLSDKDAFMCEEYGVWVQKNSFGKSFMGIERTTFLIGADGRIARVWRKVKVAGHVKEVLEAVRRL